MLRLLRCRLSHHLPYSTATATVTTAPNPQIPSFVNDPTLTLYFLQKSCNLSPAAASAAAQKINLKSTKKAHSILTLLRDYGFSELQITRLISNRPKILLVCPTRTLKPKLDFYASIGLSTDDFANHLCAKERFFYSSVKKRQAPNLRLLRLLLPTDADVLAAVRRYPSIMGCDLQKFIPVKTNALLDLGLSMDNILLLIALHPSCLKQSPDEIHSSVATVKSMGIDPSSSTFGYAYAVISKLEKPVWESRIRNFERLGWSRDQILHAFKRYPYCMSFTEERVERNVKLFAEKVGWGADKLSGSPVLISVSPEKRIMPRYRMLKMLEERGFLKDGITCRQFLLGEKAFLKSFVQKYQEKVPEILELFNGNSEVEAEYLEIHNYQHH